MYSKENLEMWRNFKWIWVPLVFIILGVLQPLSSYYLPEIIESLGGFPEGAVIEIPQPTGEIVIAETLAQYNVIGILILVLALMGIVAGERQSGVANLIAVRPVSHLSYIVAKWAGAVTLTIVSYALGVIAATYYTVTLFGSLDMTMLIQGTVTYGLWLIFIVSITLFVSAWLRSNGTIAFVTLLTAIALSLITSIFHWLMAWSPAKLPDLAAQFLLEADREGWVLSVSVTLLITIALVVGAAMIIKNKETEDPA